MTVNPQLTLQDLVRGLEQFGDRYEALDVFADDLIELKTRQPVAGLRATDPSGRRFSLSSNGKAYSLEFFDDGVVRIRKTSEQLGVGGGAALGGAAGLAIGAASTKKGEGAAAGLILGMLAGALLGGAQQPQLPRRVFTLRFDPATRTWMAYDGALVGWMKQQLAHAG